MNDIDEFEEEHRPLLPPVSDLLYDEEDEQRNQDGSILLNAAKFMKLPDDQPHTPQSSYIDKSAPMVVCDDLRTLCAGGSCCSVKGTAVNEVTSSCRHKLARQGINYGHHV